MSRGPGTCRVGRKDEGQSSVELALVLPLVAILLLLVVQVGVVAYRQVLVIGAAREGARAAAVDLDDPTGAAERAVERAGPLDAARLDVEVHPDGEVVRVDVHYVETTDVALVGALLPDVTLTAQVTMRVER